MDISRGCIVYECSLELNYAVSATRTNVRLTTVSNDILPHEGLKKFHKL